MTTTEIRFATVLAGAAGAILSLCGLEPFAHADEATVIVDAGERLGPVNRLVFGGNLEAADPTGIFAKKLYVEGVRTGDGIWSPADRKPVPLAVSLCREAGVSMLRYPGGCLVHNFDWKRTVGPLAERGDWQFGLDEFLAFCRATGAEPVMQVADYQGTRNDAADLVDYLNAPATPGHPWAMRRAAWGHPEPYGVRFFELGNESDHGNHELKPSLRFTASEYAAWAVSYIAAMKAVDPSIRIGVLSATNANPLDPWNATVYAKAGPAADFIVVHTYPGGWRGDIEVDEERAARGMMAAVPQTEYNLSRYRDQVQRYAGRAIPLGITEYNAGIVQDQPRSYRYTYAAALFCADYVRVLLKPETGVEFANYWQTFNGYWGMFQTHGTEPRRMAAAVLFKLWADHFGGNLVNVRTTSPRLDFEGFGSATWPAHGSEFVPPPALETDSKDNLFDLSQDIVHPSPSPGLLLDWHGGTFTADFKDLAATSYPVIAKIPCPLPVHPQGTSLSISFEARAEVAPGTDQKLDLGIGVSDGRSYDKTHNGTGIDHISGTEWQTYTGRLDPLPDAANLMVQARLMYMTAPVSGRLQMRNLRVSPQVLTGTSPAYDELTSSASLSEDGKTLHVILFNKNTTKPLAMTLQLQSFRAKSGKLWQVTGPLMETNLQAPNIRETVSEQPVSLAGQKAGLLLPEHSMTVVDFQVAD